MCRALRCLPKAGGLFDQDAYHIYLLESALEAQARIDEEERIRREKKTPKTRAGRMAGARRSGTRSSGDWVAANKFDE